MPDADLGGGALLGVVVVVVALATVLFLSLVTGLWSPDSVMPLKGVVVRAVGRVLPRLIWLLRVGDN